MHQNHDVLMISIRKFYGKPENIAHIVSIVNGTSDASLRMIEWFITNYAKRNDVILSKGGDQINVYHSYRSALRTFSKEQFDPFRRHDRIRFYYGDESLETTVGQLNFFKWAIETGVLDYIRANKAHMDSEMVRCGAAKRTRGQQAKEQAADPSAAELVSSASAGQVRQRWRTTLSFD